MPACPRRQGSPHSPIDDFFLWVIRFVLGGSRSEELAVEQPHESGVILIEQPPVQTPQVEIQNQKSGKKKAKKHARPCTADIDESSSVLLADEQEAAALNDDVDIFGLEPVLPNRKARRKNRIAVVDSIVAEASQSTSGADGEIAPQAVSSGMPQSDATVPASASAEVAMEGTKSEAPLEVTEIEEEALPSDLQQPPSPTCLQPSPPRRRARGFLEAPTNDGAISRTPGSIPGLPCSAKVAARAKAAATESRLTPTEREILKFEKKAREIEGLRQRQQGGEQLETLQLEKLSRSDEVQEKLAKLRLQQEEEQQQEEQRQADADAAFAATDQAGSSSAVAEAPAASAAMAVPGSRRIVLATRPSSSQASQSSFSHPPAAAAGRGSEKVGGVAQMLRTVALDSSHRGGSFDREDEASEKSADELEDDDPVSRRPPQFTTAPRILLRPQSPDNQADAVVAPPPKSLKLKQQEYAIARARIFGTPEGGRGGRGVGRGGREGGAYASHQLPPQRHHKHDQYQDWQQKPRSQLSPQQQQERQPQQQRGQQAPAGPHLDRGGNGIYDTLLEPSVAASSAVRAKPLRDMPAFESDSEDESDSDFEYPYY